MKKKLSSEQLTELEQSRSWALQILHFINEILGPNVPSYHEGIENTINETFAREDLRGMRFVVKDLTAWGKSLNKFQIQALNQRLKEKFGKDLYSTGDTKKIKSILERSAINNLREYKLLFDYFEEIYADKSKKEEAERINLLLENYQKKAGKV